MAVGFLIISQGHRAGFAKSGSSKSRLSDILVEVEPGILQVVDFLNKVGIEIMNLTNGEGLVFRMEFAVVYALGIVWLREIEMQRIHIQGDLAFATDLSVPTKLLTLQKSSSICIVFLNGDSRQHV